MAAFRISTPALELGVRRPPLALFLAISFSLLAFAVIALSSSFTSKDIEPAVKLWSSSTPYPSNSSKKLPALTPPLQSGPSLLPPEPRQLLVLPITRTNERLCRSLSAFLINGYKAPIAINWGGESNRNHYTKVQTGLAWLQDGGHDEDLVVVVDSMDVYPQLPPHAFFQQVKEYPNRPSVLIGAEKRCYPGPPHAARCTRMPDSPLPEDVYGEFTDIVNKTGKAGNSLEVDPDLEDPSSWVYGMYETIRPKYINSGTLVGTRAQLKIVYSEAAELIDDIEAERQNATHLGSDQEVFQRVYLQRQAADLETIPAPEVHMRLFQNAGHSYKDLFPHRLDEVLDKLTYYQKHILSRIAATSEWGERQIAYNHIANTVPSFMHFPGYKAGMQLWWGRMWWMQQEKSRYTFSGKKGVKSTPLYKFIQYAMTHQEEEEGYGIKLANGTWHSYSELCEPFLQSMLRNDPIP